MTFRRERKYRRRRLVAGALAAGVGVGVAGLFVVAPSRPVGPLGSPAEAQGPVPFEQDTRASPLSAAPPAVSAGTVPVASVRGLTLYVPATHVVLIGYHEAAKPEALMLTPIGRCDRDYNRTKFARPPPTAGPHYIVMSSRGRPHPATSALDVAIRAGHAALSPVTGTVASIKRYRLYGRYLDYRISIVPSDTPRLRVIIIHLDRLQVQRGSVLVAGVTPLGKPRAFPFRSQVNDYVGPGIPHIHIEVKLVGT